MTQESTAAPGSVEPARRMTLSHVLELLLARSASDRSSVTLTRNAKGETQIEVVVRTTEAGDVATVDDAYSKAVELYDKARRQYPMSTGQVGASS
jgi:hypothetical protein